MKKNKGSMLIFSLLIFGGILVIFNEISIFTITNNINENNQITSLSSSFSSDLSSVDIKTLRSTAQTIAAVFPVNQIKNSQDAVNIVLPKGTPEYGNDLGVSFDTPVESLDRLAGMYNNLKNEVKTTNPVAWNRYLAMAAAPMGISCEFCCGVGPQGVDNSGTLRCGCKHNPAVQSVALYLVSNSDYSDAQILKEVMKWKTTFYPKDMISLTTKVATGEVDVNNLPGMVGGC